MARTRSKAVSVLPKLEDVRVFPKLKGLGEVIAERMLVLERRGSRRKKVILRLGKPRVFQKGKPDHFCPFQILGIGKSDVRFAGGVDAFQAIQMVLIGIAIDLHGYRRKFGQALYFLEKGDNLGFAKPARGAGIETYQGKRPWHPKMP
jgi:hypothetical protein